MIIIQDAVISVIEKVKSATKLQKLLAYAATAVLLIIISIIFSGVRITYKVTLDGNTVATVKSVSVFEKGMKGAKALVGDIDGAEYKAVVSVNAETVDEAELKTIILEKSSSVVYGYEVTVEGKRVALLADTAELTSIMNARLDSFKSAEGESTSEFMKDISVKQIYFNKANLTDTESLKKTVDSIDVVTAVRKTTEYSVPFETVTKKTADHLAGYSKVTTKGVKGTNQKVEQLTLVNGQLTEQTTLADEILVYPTNEVVVIGTGKASYSSAVQNASAKGFIWPLAVKGTVTSYWGDGRNHQGIDVGVPQGTGILAVKSGVVIEQGYRSDYGYYVTIDHGNGVHTKYAHNKANTVKVGDSVSAGQVIALSGNTGRSTGPHLHFEVIIDGNRVNPAPYVGL